MRPMSPTTGSTSVPTSAGSTSRTCRRCSSRRGTCAMRPTPGGSSRRATGSERRRRSPRGSPPSFVDNARRAALASACRLRRPDFKGGAMATTTPLATRFKLGKLPAETDVRTLSLARYVDPAVLPPPPATLDLATRVPAWPMYANDRLGDCTTAAAGHMIQVWTAASRGHALEGPEGAGVDAFEHGKGVDPRT